MLVLSIVLGIALVAAVIVLFRVQSSRSSLMAEIAAVKQTLQAESENSRREKDRADRLAADLAAAQGMLLSAQTENARVNERIKAAEAEMERRKDDFRALIDQSETRFAELAAKALASNSEALRTQSTNSLDEILKPMRENLENFRRTISERYEKESNERSSLAAELEKLNKLSTTVSRETQRLTDALKGNSRMQGDWGEMILSEILTGAGLREGYEFTVQQSLPGEDNSRLRPDVIINYGDGRKLIVDSKVSIQDYLKMLNAETPDVREQLAKAHVDSVKKHVGELKRKQYQACFGENSFDYVLMFIPHEGAFMAAVDFDPSLWQDACRDKILIVSPAQLVPIAQTVERLWRQQQQDRNAVRIAEEAGKMLEKFMDFLADLKKIGDNIGTIQQNYDKALKRLSTGTGNLVKRARDLQTMGVKVKKTLPAAFQDIDETDEPLPANNATEAEANI